MALAKLATLGLLKIKAFWNKSYDVMISAHGVTKEIYSNYIVDVAMWPKFGNSRISMREVIITPVLSGFDQKNHLFWAVVLV